MARARLRRFGILGTGRIALDHVAALHGLGHQVSVACATSRESPRWRAFAAVAPEARFEPDGEALLIDSEVDGVVACLPWDVTERWLPRLLACPKPVLIEKPIALSSGVLRAVLERSDLMLRDKFVGFNRRFYASVQELKRRLRQGGLKAVEVTISETIGRLVERYGAQMIPHILAYSSSHILDTALYLLGPLKPVRIYAYEEQGYPAAFSSVTGILETTQGVPVSLAIHADDPVLVGIRCYFDDHTAWVLSPMERLVAYRGYEVTEPTPTYRIRRFTPQPFLERVVDTSVKPGFLEQMRAVMTGEDREIAATPAESLALLELIDALRQAAIGIGEGTAAATHRSAIRESERT